VAVAGLDGMFCAGVDLKLLPSLATAEQDRLVHGLNAAFGAAYGLGKPLIAAIGGHAIAGGLFFALTADQRIGAEGSYRLGLTEVRVGVTFPVGPLEIARAELDPQAFRSLMLFGELICPDEALGLGILDRLVPAEDVLETALAKAREAAELPPRGFAAIKRQMRLPVLAKIGQALEDGAEPALGGWVSEEARNAALAVLARKA
jgi:enoyl-CoA hydratase/carnithine racemase